MKGLIFAVGGAGVKEDCERFSEKAQLISARRSSDLSSMQASNIAVRPMWPCPMPRRRQAARAEATITDCGHRHVKDSFKNTLSIRYKGHLIRDIV